MRHSITGDRQLTFISNSGMRTVIKTLVHTFSHWHFLTYVIFFEGKFLYSKYKQALAIIHDFSDKVKLMCDRLSISESDIQS